MLMMPSIQTLPRDITGAVGLWVIIMKGENLQMQIASEETL